MILVLDDSQRSNYRDRFVLCLHTPVSETRFVRRAKVRPKTYAGELLANVYDRIFRRSLELKRDYTEYFAVEYSTFAEYLHKRFLFPKEVVHTLSQEFLPSRQIIYFHSNFSFLEGDYGREFLQKLLEPRRKK